MKSSLRFLVVLTSGIVLGYSAAVDEATARHGGPPVFNPLEFFRGPPFTRIGGSASRGCNLSGSASGQNASQIKLTTKMTVRIFQHNALSGVTKRLMKTV